MPHDLSRQLSRRQVVGAGAAAALTMTAFGCASGGPPPSSQPAARAAGPSSASPAGPDADRIVHLDRLTNREVEAWFKTSDVIFVPHGPISGHGPWTTLGVHAHGAEAVCVRLAQKC